MPSKFEIIDHKLDTILTLLEELLEREEEDLFGETEEYQAEMRSQTGEDLNPFYGREHEAPAPDVQPRRQTYRPSATRTHVEVRNPDSEGGIEMVPWTDIDERIIEAVRISAEQGEPWELWRDPTGMIRVSVEASVAHRIRKKNTVQPAPPASSEIPRDMDVDEVAKER